MSIKLSPPVNLLKTSSQYIQDYESKLNEFIKKVDGVTYVNDKFNIRAGDEILFLNGYDVPMITKVFAFKDNTAYLVWDCYWFAINLDKDFICNLNFYSYI